MPKGVTGMIMKFKITSISWSCLLLAMFSSHFVRLKQTYRFKYCLTTLVLLLIFEIWEGRQIRLILLLRRHGRSEGIELFGCKQRTF